MITPTEIHRKAQSKYPAFLQAILSNAPFFPLEIPFRKVKATDDYLQVKTGLEQLLDQAKPTLGYGYEVTLATRETRRYGPQSLPARIIFESEADYLRYLRKTREVAAFRQAVALIRRELPQLENWLRQKPRQVIDPQRDWPGLLQVCHYFLATPRPNCYIRELPLTVHTKFIEENKKILRSLLDVLLPPEAIRADQTRFERRFYLRDVEPLVRLRVLDPALLTDYGWPVTDFSSPLSEVARLPLKERHVIITENQITFLTLPPRPNSLALFGKGFQVELLKTVAWLADCDLLYWGDLDAQGFQILSQLRSYFPHTQSLLMDRTTFETFRAFAVPGTATVVQQLPHLTVEEQAMFQELAAQNLRLEQERISQAYVVERLQNDRSRPETR